MPGIMELVERTGVHSGDSISIYPPVSISQKVKETVLEYTRRLGLGIGIIGLYNIQFIVDAKEDVYVIEVNPRSSRTVPFLSKSSGFSLADIGTLAMLGVSLRDQGPVQQLSGRESPLLCEGAGLLLLEAGRNGCLSLAGNEVHRGGNRL